MAARIDWSHLHEVCAAAGPEHLLLYECLVDHKRRLQANEQDLQALRQVTQETTQVLANIEGHYAALQADYEALELAHEDLQAAYAVVHRALVRATSRN
jgi:uncharacterized protein involved in exopolysaccharide biosynthesis